MKIISFAHEMTQKGTNKDMGWENVKMRSWVLELIRKNKEKHDTPILKFVERAVLEKLQKEKK